MSNSSEGSPVGSVHTSLTEDGEEEAWEGGQAPSQLKLLQPNDQVRELQTIVRDR